MWRELAFRIVSSVIPRSHVGGLEQSALGGAECCRGGDQSSDIGIFIVLGTAWAQGQRARCTGNAEHRACSVISQERADFLGILLVPWVGCVFLAASLRGPRIANTFLNTCDEQSYKDFREKKEQKR